MPGVGDVSEALFARLCSSKYLAGFVYKNPRFKRPTQQEAGDVVLWVRDWLIIFEVIWRDPDAGPSMKKFIQRIGYKRDQLLRDFDVYADPSVVITMANEEGEPAEYNHQHFNEGTTRGVVIVDASGPIGKLHFETLRLTVEAPHPVSVMTRKDFEDLLAEADTVGDLGVYLADRHAFLKEVFLEDPGPFLRLGESLERELVGLYKLNNNAFDVGAWRASADKRFWDLYQSERREAIDRRDAQNENSQLLDGLIEGIRSSNRPNLYTLHHAYELALTMRRERVNLNERIQTKFDRLTSTGKDQKFAVRNFHTSCWDVFYLHCGTDSRAFREEAVRMARRKMWVERFMFDFRYTIFCFALRYSSLGAGSIDEIFLTGADAKDWPRVTPDQLKEGLKYFGGRTDQKRIVEFPDE